MYQCKAFETNAQSPEVVQPGKCALNNPSGSAEATAMRLARTADLGGDAGRLQWPAISVAVVAAIGLNNAGFHPPLP